MMFSLFKGLFLRSLIFLSLVLYLSSCHLQKSSATPNSLKKEKILICGVCKNVAPFLPNTISALEKVGSHFADYKVFIYEDNSSDQTAELLKQWAARNAHVSVTCETISTEDLLKVVRAYTADHLPFRTELIARARNHVLEQAMSPEYEEYKYLMMVDMDFTHEWDIDGILSSFAYKTEWDAILANGLNKKGEIYDRYAFRNKKMPLGPELLGFQWQEKIYRTGIRLKDEGKLIPVYSAFGGIGIYKRQALKNCHYSGIVTDDLEQHVKKLIKTLNKTPQVLKYINRNDENHEIVYLNHSPNAIKWIINSKGFGMPVCCEHVTLHASMIMHGHDKIFINPRMVMYY